MKQLTWTFPNGASESVVCPNGATKRLITTKDKEFKNDPTNNKWPYQLVITNLNLSEIEHKTHKINTAPEDRPKVQPLSGSLTSLWELNEYARRQKDKGK